MPHLEVGHANRSFNFVHLRWKHVCCHLHTENLCLVKNFIRYLMFWKHPPHSAMCLLSVGWKWEQAPDIIKGPTETWPHSERNLRMSGTNSSSVSWSLSQDHLQTITWVFEGLLLPTVGLVGVLGNLVSLRVIHRADLKLKPSFLRLVTSLSIFDTACILLTMALFCGPKVDETYRLQVREQRVLY